MDIQNIALVRATDIIPTDGIVRSISHVPYLCKENRTEFAEAMYDLLRRKGILQSRETLEQYMPYSSNYNSMVLWSLNGLVPDDTNNTFSNKSCAIITGLAEQLEQSEIISLVPTDTAIKEKVHLSPNSTILIRNERYEALSQQEKEDLSKLNINIKIFDGDLKETVGKALTESGRYTAENLSLYREDYGYIKSDTSDEVIETVHRIAESKGIPQILHYNVITKQVDNLDKLTSVENEFNNGLIVKDFYKKTFLEWLFSKMDIDEDVKAFALFSPDNSRCMESLCDEIGRLGINNYKSFLDTYNQTLEQLKKSGKLPTPHEIVTSYSQNKKIDLISLIEEYNTKNIILSSAIEATEEITRSGIMDKYLEIFEKSTQERSEESNEQEI